MKKFLILCGILIICVCILISCGNKKSNTPAVQEGASINAPYNETFNDGDTGQETLPTVPPDTNTPNNDEIDDSDKPNNNFGNEPPLDYSTAFYEDMIAYLQDKIKNEDGQEVDDVVKNAPLIVPRIKQDMSEQMSFKGALEFVGIYRFSFSDSAKNTVSIAIRRGVSDFYTYMMRNEDEFCVDTEDLSYNISYNHSSDTWSVYIDHTIININFPKSILFESCFEMLEEFSKYFELCDLTSQDEIVELEIPEWWIGAKTNPLVLSDVSE